jgi:hypothetical protein
MPEGRSLITVRKVSSRFVTVRGYVEQSGASSICLWQAREGIRRCQREGQGHDFQSNGSCGVTDVDSSLLEYDILSISSQSLYSISLKAS